MKNIEDLMKLIKAKIKATENAESWNVKDYNRKLYFTFMVETDEDYFEEFNYELDFTFEDCVDSIKDYGFDEFFKEHIESGIRTIEDKEYMGFEPPTPEAYDY